MQTRKQTHAHRRTGEVVSVAAGAEALPRGADGVAGEARAGVTLDGKRGAVACRHKKKTTRHMNKHSAVCWLLELEAGNIPCFFLF